MPTYRERVAEDIYMFTSELYAQVTAGVIATREGSIVVDTLPFPQESRELRDFAERISPGGVRYVLLTHSHADHANGLYLFPRAEAICHKRCRELLLRYGQRALDEAKKQTPELAEVRLRIPRVTFDETLTVRLGDKTVTAMYAPGHSPDVAMVYVKELKVLFASDTVMPVPYIVGGDPGVLIESLRKVRSLPLESIVQGHGEVLLRGEIKEVVDSSIAYLETIQRLAREYVESGQPRREIARIDIESCGKSRIPLGGLVQSLHRANLLYLYDRYRSQRERQPESVPA
ncbi:MAG: MBL fold metallo-hydrolase [Anaerolineae bacterium]|nr:MBL fold metallo-hydrolase [Anaerolineae bacterium]